MGFCGAFTTFSTFAVDTLAQRPVNLGLLNVVVNNVLAITASAIGLYLGQSLRPDGP